MYKLIFFVPTTNKEVVKQAIFATGAGSQGNYANCCFESEGIGEFLPLTGANPTIGNQGIVERVSEFRVEILCSEQNIQLAVSALKEAHPYEEVAFDVIKCLTHFN